MAPELARIKIASHKCARGTKHRHAGAFAAILFIPLRSFLPEAHGPTAVTLPFDPRAYCLSRSHSCAYKYFAKIALPMRLAILYFNEIVHLTHALPKRATFGVC
jgi:hypothetical protein